jgi:hypothetical protein
LTVANVPARLVASVEATEQGLDIRYVVISLRIGSAEWIYDSLYCAHGQAEKGIVGATGRNP